MHGNIWLVFLLCACVRVRACVCEREHPVVLSFMVTSLSMPCFSTALIDLSESATDERKPVDIYAIGFEEMVDLDAKNIVNAR